MRDEETACFQERYRNESYNQRNRLPADQHRITTAVLLSGIEGFTTDHDVGCFALFRIPYNYSNIEYIQVFFCSMCFHTEMLEHHDGGQYTPIGVGFHLLRSSRILQPAAAFAEVVPSFTGAAVCAPARKALASYVSSTEVRVSRRCAMTSRSSGRHSYKHVQKLG